MAKNNTQCLVYISLTFFSSFVSFFRISWTVETKKTTKQVDALETCTLTHDNHDHAQFLPPQIHSPGSMTCKLLQVLDSQFMISHPVRLPAHHTSEVAVFTVSSFDPSGFDVEALQCCILRLLHTAAVCEYSH